MPFKYQVFDLAKDAHDVIWVYRDGALNRCWHHPTEGPVCAEAAFLKAAELQELLKLQNRATSPVAPWPPEVGPKNPTSSAAPGQGPWRRGDGPIPPAP